jgi:hypothetical protein
MALNDSLGRAIKSNASHEGSLHNYLLTLSLSKDYAHEAESSDVLTGF